MASIATRSDSMRPTVVGALLSLFAGCSGDGNVPGGRIEELPPLEPTTASIQEFLIDARCMPCHKDAKKFNRYTDLRDVAKLSMPSTGPNPRVLLVPGCPNKSVFFSMLKEQRMPPEPDPPVNEADLGTIAQWITEMVPESERQCDDTDEPGGSDPDPDEPGDDEPGDLLPGWNQ